MRMPQTRANRLERFAHSRALKPLFPLPRRSLVDEWERYQIGGCFDPGIASLEGRAGERKDSRARYDLGAETRRKRGIVEIEDIRIDFTTAEIRRTGCRLKDDVATAKLGFELR